MVAALLLGGPLALLDAEDHAHTVCAEHGEFIHSGHPSEAEISDRPTVSAASGADDHHEHCSILAITRKLSATQVASAYSNFASTTAAEPFAKSNEIAHRPIAIAHYAPSQSPPARA